MISASLMEELFTYRQDLLSALDGVIRDLYRLMSILPEGVWRKSFGSAAKTPHFRLALLRALECEVFPVYIHSILSAQATVLEPFHMESWEKDQYQLGEPIGDILDDLADHRKQELIFLRNISPVDWSKSTRHPWYGKRTVQWWVELQLDISRQLVTELSHLRGK